MFIIAAACANLWLAVNFQQFLRVIGVEMRSFCRNFAFISARRRPRPGRQYKKNTNKVGSLILLSSNSRWKRIGLHLLCTFLQLRVWRPSNGLCPVVVCRTATRKKQSRIRGRRISSSSFSFLFYNAHEIIIKGQQKQQKQPCQCWVALGKENVVARCDWYSDSSAIDRMSKKKGKKGETVG